MTEAPSLVRTLVMSSFTYDSVVDLSYALMDADDDDEDEEETWHVLMGPGDVKAVSLDRLNDLYRLDVIDDRTYVWKLGMATWQPLFLVIGAMDEDEEAERPWNVLVGPGEVKQLSLEQLDDWYRLDLIDARTLVWQEGMASWQPLGAVAGIESTAARGMPFVPSSPPVAFTLPAPAERRGAGERWLVRLALAAGLLMTVYRNDFVTEMARSAHQEPAFEQLQQRLGGPGFGTVRSVETLIESNGLRLPEVRVPEMLVAREVERLASAEQAPAPSAARANAAKTPPSPSAAVSARPQSSALGSAASPLPLGSADRPRHGRSRGTKPGRSTLDNIIPEPGKSRRSGGSEYDPLNPNL